MRIHLTLLAALALLAETSWPGDAFASRPNVLFIAVDDLRPELGCYGTQEIRSPSIDRLAAGGIVFTSAYCQQAVCNPSRASLMTGLRPDSTRVWDLVTHFRDTIPDVVTLPQHFKKHGYEAVAYGKIYHNPLPDRQSWNEPNHWPRKATTWSQAGRQQLAGYRAKMRVEGKSDAAVNRMRAPATDDEDVPDSRRPDGEIADQALQAMRRLATSEQPFFLAVGFLRPHLPFTPPKKYWNLYRRDELTLAVNQILPSGSPPMAMNTMYELRDYMDFADSPSPREGSLTEDQRRRLKHGYYASVSFVDAQVGRLLGTLEELGLADDTIVVLWGDHGWKLGEHNSWCKQTNYEIDTRVPLIIRSPRAKANGESCPALVEFVDVYPTLCELAGLPLPGDLEGRSVAPLLEKPDQPWKEAVFSQFRRRHEGVQYMGYAMRTDRYRFVEWINRHSLQTVATELYDQKHDPRENTNLAAKLEHRLLVGQLSDQLWSSLPKPKPLPGNRPANRPQMTFQNRLDEPVTVWWIPAEGDRKLAGKIAPGQQLDQRTTLGHRFLAEGDLTAFRRVVVVDSAERTVVLQKSTGPNILVLMGDDWSWPHAGALGDPVVKTPAFDRIAREGVTFDNAFVSSPSCTPSRMAIAAGQWHWRLGDAANLGGSLAADVKVYPEILESAGYRIGFARKGAEPSKHLHRGRDPFGPRFRSFEQFLEDRQIDEPFCFWYGAGEPHRPYRAGTGVKSGLDPADAIVPGYLPDNQTVRSDLCDYHEAIQRFDRDADRMLAALEKTGELDNTLIVVSGDNGMPFPRAKATLYDAGTHVPLIIRWPRQIPGGRTARDVVSLTDLAPTFLEAAGLPVVEAMTGSSLLSILKSDRSGQIEPGRTFTLTGMERHVYAYPSRAIRTRDFLYIRNFDPQAWPTGESTKAAPSIDYEAGDWPTHEGAFSFNIDPSPTKQFLLDHRKDPAVRPLFNLACGRRPPEELYDLREDPQQLRNVAAKAEYADKCQELSGRLEVELRESDDPRFVDDPQREAKKVPREATSASALGRFRVQLPPPELGANPCYTKYVDAGGYPILASARVNDYALAEAAFLVSRMLAHRPDVKDAMVESGSRMLILAHDEFTTDLPEFAHMKPKDYWDARARGTGGSQTDPYCSCGEENLLGYRGDPYVAECILIHEFAHNIHLRGLVNIDPTFDQRLGAAYEQAMAKGLWKGKYASVNHHEYFAEGVQSWFDNNRPPDHDHNHVDTREELLAYDPSLAEICREVFGDTKLVYTKPATRLEGHLEGYDPATAPTFRWPERLNEAREEIFRKARSRASTRPA